LHPINESWEAFCEGALWQASRQTIKGKIVGTVDRVGIMNRSAPYTNLPEGTKLYTYPISNEMLETTDVWQYFSNGEWCVGSNLNNHKQNTIYGGYLVRDLCVSPTTKKGD
jgi:hypothetical protein